MLKNVSFILRRFCVLLIFILVVYGLRDLFEQLRISPTSSVTPTTELANLTLLSDQKVAQYRRDSVATPPPLDFMQPNIPIYSPDTPAAELAVYGPQPRELVSPTLTPPPDEDAVMADQPADRETGTRDDSSESTLVETGTLDSPGNEGHKLSENPFSDDNSLEPEDTLKTFNVEEDIVMINGQNAATLTAAPPVPENPPPVPPRNKPDQDLWAFGAQQDVTEVVGNVVFRLQCAIKADRIEDESGEQIDSIRDTFYGANATYTQKARVLEKKIESWGNLIIYPDPSGDRDIYAALDVTFDMQMVEVENMQTRQYTSITKLPPILQMHIQRTAFDNVK